MQVAFSSRKAVSVDVLGDVRGIVSVGGVLKRRSGRPRVLEILEATQEKSVHCAMIRAWQNRARVRQHRPPIQVPRTRANRKRSAEIAEPSCWGRSAPRAVSTKPTSTCRSRTFFTKLSMACSRTRYLSPLRVCSRTTTLFKQFDLLLIHTTAAAVALTLVFVIAGLAL